ncbi:Elongator complex protein 1 [Toxocara canis]|uniref:Elongator complex protein 1 n=1 Tax=Toxocara canis TaxID=6265 RepID=A0A0B2UX53_TOXCA|nr:Elongator complex protein 1 [Toxocara canis]
MPSVLIPLLALAQSSCRITDCLSIPQLRYSVKQMEKNVRVSEVVRLPHSERINEKRDGATRKSLIDGVQRVCMEPINHTVYCATAERVFQLGAEEEVWLDWSAERGNNEVVAFDFLYDDAKIFALLSNGMALLVDVLSKTIDVVIVLNDELCGGCWAPDVHVLVVASKHNIYFVSREFDIISEQLLNPLSAGQCELMSVGWGSKQTQFQGSTAARKQKSQVEVDEETEVSALDSRRPLFSWSGDSQCVAVSFVEERGIRKTCLWSDEGELISRLQPLPFVEEALTYRCSQNVTVMCAVQNGIRKVVFFEHNGQMLSHYEIEKLSAERNRVIWMSWNASCDMLAIRIRSSTSFEEVQWWYLINGAFSLKYRLEFTDGLVDSWWNRTDPHWFYYLTHDGDCIALRFEFTYTFCDTTLFAIKGRRVCVTHLDKRVSPVCEEFVELPDTVCELAVYSGWVLFYLTSRFFVIYELVKGEPVERGIFDARGCHNDAPLFCLRYGGGNQLTAIDAHSKYRVVEITLDAGRAISRDIHESAQPLCYHVVTKKGLAVQTNLGDWMYVEEIDDRSCVEFSKQSFWKKQRIVDCCYNAEHDIVVGRNAGKALILNDRLVANGVESYSLGRRFLVYLSSGSALHSLQLHIYELNNDNVNGVGINSGRFVECGAAIIGHDEEGARIWLQMARGILL